MTSSLNETPDPRPGLVIGWTLVAILFVMGLNPLGIWDGPNEQKIIANILTATAFASAMFAFLTAMFWPRKSVIVPEASQE